MGSPDGSERCVLVVDDDPLMGRAVARLIRPRCPVELCGSAEEALARLRARRYEVVLCDVRFRGATMDGSTLYAQIRDDAPEQAARFVFMTGGVGDAAHPEVVVSAGRPILEKPFTPGELDAILDPLLGLATSGPTY
jgi:CheY-like chemotaxis protein